MSAALKQALVAMHAFAEATRRQYLENLELFHTPKGAFTDPLSKATPYAVDKLAAAQNYTDKGQASFVMLAHLEGSEVGFLESEALVWLGNDATVFDVTVQAKPMRVDERLQGVAQVHGERAVARAIFLRCLLAGYIRALEVDLFQRAMKQESGIRDVAQALVKQSVQEFEASMGLYVKSVAFQREVIAFAQSVEFPLFPLAIGQSAQDKEMFNGVALTPELAQQMRAHFAAGREKREKK